MHFIPPKVICSSFNGADAAWHVSSPWVPTWTDSSDWLGRLSLDYWTLTLVNQEVGGCVKQSRKVVIFRPGISFRLCVISGSINFRATLHLNSFPSQTTTAKVLKTVTITSRVVVQCTVVGTVTKCKILPTLESVPWNSLSLLPSNGREC